MNWSAIASTQAESKEELPAIPGSERSNELLLVRSVTELFGEVSIDRE